MSQNLQPRSDVDFATGDFGRANENVAAVATGAIYADRVLAGVGLRGVE